MTIKIKNGLPVYYGDTFTIKLARYSDPDRLHAARNAARYLGKSDIDNIRRPLSIIRMGHVPAIFRGEMAEFEFVDVSKEVYDHLATYSTANMRVAGGNRALKSDGYTMPSDRMQDPEMVKTWIENSMESYHCLLDHKETPQVARSAMPVNAKMNTFVFQFNFLTLGQSVFKQRIWEKGAQGNTAKVVQAMYELVEFMDSQLWTTFYEWYGQPSTDWVEVRRKIKKKKITLEEFVERTSNADGNILLEDMLVELYGEQKSMW
ncbi:MULTISPECIES: FAD-dependent thymidylate synthase [unclassified Sporosarcina]|uniref:FAD-dependent thymidylate synthase n=1 Tax=unclassified Sporosarcina TaxID=2647733 RepID=UPI002041AF65|nr:MULTISPECIES: FAD-dependent thymidylate synthase [unclassified Sporosarcina]GKV65486.1 hypothetical protein NCCP2331_16390 [Sporosarcina sp. NCCP-2331]GLB55611.1 hypothetical protein NCCP2378_13980 [Sporosarcina sp. NCCP-2378]